MAGKNASFLKVRVFRDNGEAVVFGVLPNLGIIGATESTLMHVGRIRVDVGQSPGQARGEILVKKKFHALEISTLRSRSAA